MVGWNIAELWERCAARRPDAPALRHGGRVTTWAGFDRRADGVARTLLEAGLGEQAKVAQLLTNCPAYLEAVFGALKAGMVPVNTNHRYGDDELAALWADADAEAVVFHGAFADRVARVRPRVPAVRRWLWVDDGTGPCPPWATPHEEAARSATGRVVAPWGRSGDHLVLVYTGGTTGQPKGVMWRQDDLVRALVPGAGRVQAPAGTVEATEQLWAGLHRTGLQLLPACPLMHGTGLFTAILALVGTGSVTTLVGRQLDVVELLDTVVAERIDALAIVGDPFAAPIVAALDAEPDRWDLSHLAVVTSSGVMWSEPVKEGLLRHQPGLVLIDAFSSSEAIGLGQAVTAGGAPGETARFKLGRRARVVDEGGADIPPGSGRIGRVVVGGPTPLGYYKDPEATARTFVELDGRRWAMPGDWARVGADGTITLLGRGSQCINTGGEKVFPEEVEEVLKRHPAVRDAAVVGLPDDRYGQQVAAVVEPATGHQVDEAALVAHVKAHLASFKAPRAVVAIDTIGRGANGKVDYERLGAYAAARAGR